MNINLDAILIILAGMILGGFIVARTEQFFLHKYSEKPSRGDYMRRVYFIESFVSVFVFVLNLYLFKVMILYGLCIGALIFSMKPIKGESG